jgi:hypothetical protein
LLADGDKGMEKAYVEEKKILYWTVLNMPRQNKNILYQHDKPKEPTKKGPHSFVLFESYSPQFQQSAGGHPSP